MTEDKLDIDIEYGTAYRKGGSGRGRLFFLRKRFNDGCILGFYSDNPCGNVHGQERGWVVIDDKRKKIIAECQTYYYGPGNGDYKDWIKEQKEIHGGYRPNSTWREYDGSIKWKMKS